MYLDKYTAAIYTVRVIKTSVGGSGNAPQEEGTVDCDLVLPTASQV